MDAMGDAPNRQAEKEGEEKTEPSASHYFMERYRVDGMTFELYSMDTRRSDGMDAAVFVATTMLQIALNGFRSLCCGAPGHSNMMLLLSDSETFENRNLNQSHIASQKAFAEYDGDERDYESV